MIRTLDYSRLQHGLGEVAHCLSYAEVSKDILSSTKDRVEAVRPVEHLNVFAHASLRQAAATPNLDCIIGDILGGTGAAELEQTDGTSQMLGLLLVGHVAHLVSNGFKPRLVGFDEGNHLGEPEGLGLARGTC